jgi:chemotaxis signal transduction protein
VALFDRQGRILAVSKDPHSLAPGAALPAALLQRTLALKGQQAYAVSAMEPHALADGEHTYLYCAPIRRSGSDQVLGGMALAFNCRDELQAMLKDALPEGAAALGFFIDPTGRVLASTDSSVAVGSFPDCVTELLAQPASGSAGRFCQWQGQTYLAGLAPSKGYREFKVTDGYREEVQSVLLTPVGRSAAVAVQPALPQRQSQSGPAPSHYGVVQCGRMLFGLGSTQVLEAVAALRLSAAPVASQAVGMMEYAIDGKSSILPVYDACKLTGQPPMAQPSKAVAIVVRRQQQHIALLVDRLIDVIESDPISEPPGGVNPHAPWISGYIHDSQPATEPVFTLDPELLAVTAAA